MAQDMGEAHDYASFGGENADLAGELADLIKMDSKHPRMDSQAHTNRVSDETHRLTGEKPEEPKWLRKAREGLANIYADRVQAGAEGKGPDNTIAVAGSDQSNDVLPAVDTSTTAETSNVEQSSESTPANPTQSTEVPELTPNQGDNQTDTTGESEPEPPNEATASSPEDIPTDDNKGSATAEAEPTHSSRTIEYGGHRVIWSERREKALNNPNFTDEQKQNIMDNYFKHDQASITRGGIDSETLAELGLGAEGKPPVDPDEVAEAEAAATNAGGTGAEGDPNSDQDTDPDAIPEGTFRADDMPPGPINIPESDPPPADSQEASPTGDRHGNPGEFSRIIGRATVEIWNELRERHLLERAKHAFDNWRNNSRRRSERLRAKYEADGRPDTKWQKWRVEQKEKSEERRAAFWDKWLGTKIGQKEDERSGGREGRRRLIDRPEEGMDRAIRLLANLRNDQERFRGIGLHRNRDKVQQIEAGFRQFACQEVADKVSSMIEERLTERAGHMKAADIIRSAMARSEEESHLSGEPLEAYIQEINQSVASKGEFATLSHIAGKHMEKYFSNPNDRDELAKGIALLDTIKALSDAHDEGLIGDQVIFEVNQLTYEGKNLEEIIDEFSQTITPEEVQAATIGSILDIMQKVDQAQAEMKNTYRKNDGKIHQFLSSPRWNKGVGTVIAGAGTIGMFTIGPLGAVVASGGIFMARQSGMRERVENRANKRAGQQAELIDRVIEDPLIQDMYRRLDVTLPTHGSDVVDLPSREHLRADRLSDYNARELAEALASEEIISNEERLSAITEQIIDSMLTTSSNRARSKLTHRMWSTSFSAFASSLPVVVTSPSIFFGSRVIRSGIALGSVALPLVGAWRSRKTYEAVKPPAR